MSRRPEILREAAGKALKVISTLSQLPANCTIKSSAMDSANRQ